MVVARGRKKVVFVSLSTLLLCSLLSAVGFAANVTYDHRAVVIDGKRRVLVSGSIHYPRSTPDMWPDLIQKSKDGGLDVIETYVFWDLHEPVREQVQALHMQAEHVAASTSAPASTNPIVRLHRPRRRKGAGASQATDTAIESLVDDPEQPSPPAPQPTSTTPTPPTPQPTTSTPPPPTPLPPTTTPPPAPQPTTSTPPPPTPLPPTTTPPPPLTPLPLTTTPPPPTPLPPTTPPQPTLQTTSTPPPPPQLPTIIPPPPSKQPTYSGVALTERMSGLHFNLSQSAENVSEVVQATQELTCDALPPRVPPPVKNVYKKVAKKQKSKEDDVPQPPLRKRVIRKPECGT